MVSTAILVGTVVLFVAMRDAQIEFHNGAAQIAALASVDFGSGSSISDTLQTANAASHSAVALMANLQRLVAAAQVAVNESETIVHGYAHGLTISVHEG